MIGAELTTTRTMVVPVILHAAHTGTLAPQQVMVSLRGPRALLGALSVSDLAAHIDDGAYERGFQHLVLTAQHLLLPPGVSLVNYVEIPLFVGKSLS